MNIIIPEFANKKDLFSFLVKNVEKLISQKKSLPIKSDNLDFGYSIVKPERNTNTVKSDNNQVVSVEVEGEVGVDIIANVAGWCDSQMDVMLRDSWKKSINDIGASGQKLIYHLKNHSYKTDSIIGKDPSLYTKDIDLSMFNFTSDIKKSQALCMSSLVLEEYDEKTYLLYKDKQIKQHSIGIQYVKIYLCINSDEAYDASYKENWDKYYSQVINKDKVDSKGYFWAVTEAKILEVSAVLFGANELTPVIGTSLPADDTEDDPQKSNQFQPLQNQDGNQGQKQMAICPTCNTFLSVSSTEAITCSGCGQYVSPLNQSAQTNWENIAAAIN